MNETFYVGIDFSLNSTGICIEYKNQNYFLSFFNECKFNHKKKNFDFYKELESKPLLNELFLDTNNVKLCLRKQEPLPKPKTIGINVWGQKQMDIVKTYTDFIISNFFSKLIEFGWNEKTKVIIGIENYSYDSFGDATIQIIEMTSVLKQKLLDFCELENTNIIPAPTIKKKYSVGGNANKFDMFKSYLDLGLKDKFSLFVKNNENSLYKEKWKLTSKGKAQNHEVLSPVDDLIDSYFIKEYVKYYLKGQDNFQ